MQSVDENISLKNSYEYCNKNKIVRKIIYKKYRGRIFKLKQLGKSFLSVFCITLLFVLQRILLHFREYEEILKYNLKKKLLSSKS